MLKIDFINSELQKRGLTQTDLADLCGVTKEATSNWLSGESFPRPKALKALANVLEVETNDLLTVDESTEPVIAFRMRKNAPLTPEAASAADTVARHLRELLPFLQSDPSFAPPVLTNPKNDDTYVIEATRMVRERGGATATEPLSLARIVSMHRAFGSILVPVLWGGEKDGHENALSVYLPDSKTSFVVVSLNSHEDDFHYWLAHELGHCYSLHALRDNEGEAFAERFAQELLFPMEVAAVAYNEVVNSSKPKEVYERYAKHYEISVVTVVGQLDRFARTSGKNTKALATPKFYEEWQAAHVEVPTMSQNLFGTNQPEPEAFVDKAEATFNTSVYQAIGKWQQHEGGRSPSFIASTLNIGLSDAFQLSHALAKAAKACS